MSNPDTYTQIGQQDPTDPAPEMLQSIDGCADYQEAIASIAQGLSESMEGRGIDARRFFQELQASRG